MNLMIQDTHDTLRQLVLRAQRGDREAFGELFQRYERSVYATALRRLGNESAALELCQEVFLQAMRKIHQLREPDRLGAWLRSIARRMAINCAVRKGPVVSAEPATLVDVCVENSTPLEGALTNERASQVRDGLSRLNKLDRETLVAFYVDGCSIIEMSESFNSPVGTIKRRLHVARQRLAKELADMAV